MQIKKLIIEFNYSRVNKGILIMSRMNIDTSLLGVLYARWEVMSERKQKRDVYVAIADPTRRKLLHLLAEAVNYLCTS